MGARIGDIDVFAGDGDRIDGPCGVIAAGDEVWFTAIAESRIGRVLPADGRIERYADSRDRIRLPANLFPAADGRIWVTCLGSDALASIDPRAADPAASIAVHAHPDLRRPVAIKSARSGLLWFTARGSAALGSIDPRAADPARTIRLLHSPSIEDPSALYIAADDRVWWVNAASRTVGCLDPRARDIAASVLAYGPWPAFGAPRAWAQDAAGTLWATTQDRPGLLAIDPADPASARWRTDPRLRTPDGVCVGADGALWMVDTDADAIVRFDPAGGGWDSFTDPGVAGPFDIKPGPAGTGLWFTNKRGGTLGRIRDAG